MAGREGGNDVGSHNNIAEQGAGSRVFVEAGRVGG